MLDSSNYLMVALRLTKAPAGKLYHRILSASRRCLEDFSIPFGDTGYRLVLRSEEAALIECLNKGFLEYYTDEDMVILSAPERDSYSEYYYEFAESSLLEALATELRSVAERIAQGNRVTTRTYAEAIRLLDRCEHHFVSEQSVYIRKILGKLYQSNIEGRRKSVSRKINELAELAYPLEE